MANAGLLSRDQIAGVIQKVRTAIFSKANTTPISIRQNASLKGEAPEIAPWVSHVELPAPPSEQDGVQQLLLKAIETLGQGNEQYVVPSLQRIQAQWTSATSNLPPGINQMERSDEAKYHSMMDKVTCRVTILYVHGGAFVLNTPARFRKTIACLATLTGGRCFSINYRLAPQHPFPAALLDVLVGYLSLLYPPPGSHHSAICASSIVLAGDSSGACLALALIQVILSARKTQGTNNPVVRFHGRQVVLQMPSGLALQSPLGDQTNSLPSWKDNGTFDVVQELSPVMLPDYPRDSIWPSSPPRGDVYCESSMICHPLVSPTAALDWAGAPPMWFALGEERMVDAAKVIVQRAAAQGVHVRLELYEAMPHNWPMLFPTWWQSDFCMERWAHACRDYVEDRVMSSSVEYVSVNKDITKQDVGELSSFTPEEALVKMREKQATLKPWFPRNAIEKL